MKKIFIMALLCAMPTCLLAQYTAWLKTDPTPTYLYVGSLNMSSTYLGNAEKIKVEVFGGSWESDDLGETTYYIANRGVLNIHRVILGSSNNNFFSLQAFDNGTDNIDFYIVSAAWTAIAVRSVMLGGPTPVTQNVAITTSTTTPPGTPHALYVLPVITTDEWGNMAIGTNTIDPDYKLSVGGGIRAAKIVVENGWADCVFDKGYQLKPLHEVADYVHTNHHLPDVPTATDIKKSGINVGETETVLLKKIEELTLYLIEKDKQVKEQQADLKRQERRLKKLEQRIEQMAKKD
jgi:hypothetical protein